MGFILDSNKRENLILEVYQNAEPIATGLKLPILTDQDFVAYKIPIEYLVYNHLNDRFASKREEFTVLNGKSLDILSEETMMLIEEFIWESNVSSNQTTLNDLVKNGQKIPGVITKDGRIIDGNRRASLMRRIFNNHTEYNVDREKFRYFSCIVLKENISDAEMLILETKIQMGEDPKLEYNAIEKYLKINKLYELGSNYKEIAGMINSIKNEKEVEEMHKRYRLMVEYLEYIEAPHQFSLIQRFEDHFINLNKFIQSYKNGKITADWNPTNSDYEEAKIIAFNFIRKGHEGKDFRNLFGSASTKQGIFKNQQVWAKFVEKHNKIVNEVEKELKHQKFENTQQKESIWIHKTCKSLDNSFANAKESLSNRAEGNKPKELLEGALDKINSVDISEIIDSFELGKVPLEYIKQIYEQIKDLEQAINLQKESIVKNVFTKKQ